MMAEQADDQEIIYHIYMGGQDVVPRNATHVRVDKSVKVISELAFFRNPNLQSVETHDGVEKIDNFALKIQKQVLEFVNIIQKS